MLRVDKEATERAGFKDPRSYVCLASFRIHQGTEHPCVYLAGQDVGIRRAEVFFLAHYRCRYCGEFCKENGILDHIVGGLGSQRCYCYENLQLLCPPCNEKKTRESEHH